MKQLLLIIAVVVGQPVLGQQASGSVLITDPILKEHFGKIGKKPYGKFAPPLYLTKSSVAAYFGLELIDTNIRDSGLKDVAKLQKLEGLSLYVTKITDAGLKDVAKLKRLDELILSRTQVTDAGLKELAKMKWLHTLDLTDTVITDAGLPALAKLHPRLTYLYLMETQVTEGNMRELRKAMPKCRIYISYLSDGIVGKPPEHRSLWPEK